MASKSTAKRKPVPAGRKPVAKKPSARPARTGHGTAAGGSRVRPKPAAVRPRPKAPGKVSTRSPEKPPVRLEGPLAVPNAMGLMVAHVDFTTHNFDEVRRFYTQQMGFTRFDFDPDNHYLTVHTTNSYWAWNRLTRSRNSRWRASARSTSSRLMARPASISATASGFIS